MTAANRNLNLRLAGESRQKCRFRETRLLVTILQKIPDSVPVVVDIRMFPMDPRCLILH